MGNITFAHLLPLVKVFILWERKRWRIVTINAKRLRLLLRKEEWKT